MAMVYFSTPMFFFCHSRAASTVVNVNMWFLIMNEALVGLSISRRTFHRGTCMPLWVTTTELRS